MLLSQKPFKGIQILTSSAGHAALSPASQNQNVLPFMGQMACRMLKAVQVIKIGVNLGSAWHKRPSIAGLGKPLHFSSPAARRSSMRQ